MFSVHVKDINLVYILHFSNTFGYLHDYATTFTYTFSWKSVNNLHSHVCYGTITDIWLALQYMIRHNYELVCRGSTIMLSIQVVTVVTNHDQFNNGHAWMDT